MWKVWIFEDKNGKDNKNKANLIEKARYDLELKDIDEQIRQCRKNLSDTIKERAEIQKEFGLFNGTSSSLGKRSK